MSLIKLELDSKRQETRYINMMLSKAYRALGDAVKDKINNLSKEVLFCTPEEAEAVFFQNTSLDSKCRIDDHGIAYFEVNAVFKQPRGQKKMSYYNSPTSSSTYASTATTSSSLNTTGSITAGTGFMYDTVPGNGSPLRYTSNVAIDNKYITAALSKLKLENGNEITIELPDGATLEVKADGSYKVFGCDGLEEHNSHSIKQGQEVSFDLPNGAKLEVKRDGSIEVKDDKAKVVYKANKIKEFNRFINASDLLQEFIAFLGTLGVKQGQVFDIPIELFINWLVFKAAAQDEENPPEDLTSPETHPKLLQAKGRMASPKCLCCGRFIRKDLAIKGFNFCSGVHASRFADRLSLAS